MSIFVMSIIMLVALSYLFYTMMDFKKTIANYEERIGQLSNLLNTQQDETRVLLTAYMTESRVISFYDDITPLIRDKEVIQLFQRLAKDEEKHISLLENCLAANKITGV